MRIHRLTRVRVPLCAGLLCLGLALQSGAERASPAADANADRARAVLESATRTLERAHSLRARFEMRFDIVQGSGQHLEFGATRTLAMRRPDRLRVDARRRDGTATQFYFDGQTGTLYHPSHRVYSSAPMGPTVDAAIETLEERLGVPVPLADLVRSDLQTILTRSMEAALWVGEETLGGTPCEHIAFRTAEVDLQLWVAVEPPRLIQRVVITYPEEEGSPQFRADLLNWELDLQLPDSLFEFEPPAGAEQVPFVELGGTAVDRAGAR